MSKIKRVFGVKKTGIDKMLKSLFMTIENLQPELILLGHSELIDGQFLGQLKSKYPNIKIAMWWVDWLKNLSSIQTKMDYLDVLFVTTGINDPTLKDIQKKNLKICYLPNMCDDSIEVYKSFEEKSYDRDLFFAGRLDTEREAFLTHLQKSLDPLKFDIFGNTKNNILLGSQFLQTIAKSKISLNLSRDHESPLYTSDRLIQLLGNGSMVISKRIPDFDMLFDDKEIIFFDTLDECIDLIKYYSANDEKRKEVACNGWTKAHKSYNSTRVAKFMIEAIFDLDYTEAYEWENECVKR
ncbi:glycosyltransferase [Sulfurovum sp. XGS-02]|uniref:glycosyltransferase family protein n=1 Tax=Sulfurovum sp. XGS-02 TaxID=2925411 RepID=UPI002059E8E5|nr:glycosyltransferase [Sulfurovum sp. XGS-02]UPT77174.1 glycosyltransferase [Sulfurovum sp. XGS-02]